jgi:S-DNA-T family DNA segregation ATPase FtsK/SpoIIIE
VLHGPDHVKVIAVIDEGARVHWDWLKWLPHHQHPPARGLRSAWTRSLLNSG